MGEFDTFLGKMEAGKDLIHRLAASNTNPTDATQAVTDLEEDCKALLETAQKLRESEDATIAMFGFRMQMLVYELIEAKHLQDDADHIHIREFKKQAELLNLAISRTASAQQKLNEST